MASRVAAQISGLSVKEITHYNRLLQQFKTRPIYQIPKNNQLNEPVIDRYVYKHGTVDLYTKDRSSSAGIKYVITNFVEAHCNNHKCKTGSCQLGIQIPQKTKSQENKSENKYENISVNIFEPFESPKPSEPEPKPEPCQTFCIWSEFTDIKVKVDEMKELGCWISKQYKPLIRRARNIIIPEDNVLQSPTCRVQYGDITEKVYSIKYGKVYVTSSVVCNIFCFEHFNSLF